MVVGSNPTEPTKPPAFYPSKRVRFNGYRVNRNHHDFSFTALYNSTYRIRMGHNSIYDLHLVIEILPKGWEGTKL
ncbi:MAG: hypothetical protein GQ507_03085 [Dehalococcoidales bacterium]|nr:hypothetical protein [Dehalococcoidales bacterium]